MVGVVTSLVAAMLNASGRYPQSLAISSAAPLLCRQPCGPGDAAEKFEGLFTRQDIEAEQARPLLCDQTGQAIPARDQHHGPGPARQQRPDLVGGGSVVQNHLGTPVRGRLR